MKTKKMILISLLLILLALISIGAIAAGDNEGIDSKNTIATNEIANDNIISTDNSISEDLATTEEIEKDNSNLETSNSKLETSNNNSKLESSENSDTTNKLKTGNTITVDGTALNQMSNPTIQNAIDSASEGDTIIITGKNYVHCHFIVNKQLTIISEVKTTMSPCPSNTQGSGSHGVFYINSGGSGTILQGFSFTNDYGSSDDYGVYINGASNVTINNCTVKSVEAGNGIWIKDSTNVEVNNSYINKSSNGIYIQNSKSSKIENSIMENNTIGIKIESSNLTEIRNNNISNNSNTGINIGVNNINTTVDFNNITYNRYTGMNISSGEYIDIYNNFISYNRNGDANNYTTGSGIYINCNVTKINIIGNVILQNGIYGVLSDYRVMNVDASKGSENIIYTENNYFGGHEYRVVYHIKYIKTSSGSFTYDADTDIYTYVGSGNGDYDIDKTVVYLGHAYLMSEIICGATLYKAPNTVYGSGADYQLLISNISQVKKGVYSVSITDTSGNAVSDISSLYVNFYLNKNTSSATPGDEDIYKTIKMENGTATVDFTNFAKYFKESGNVITASFPGLTAYYKNNPYVTYSVDDSDIPGQYSQTTISVANTTLAPKSGDEFYATLLDDNGNPVANQTINFKISGGSTVYNGVTDDDGKASIKINLGSSTYTVTVTYNGSEEYNKSSATANLIVKKLNTVITSSDMEVIPQSGELFKITLKDSNGKVLANQKINFTIGSKTYTRTTDSNGQASLKINLANIKTYTITTKFAKTSQYNAKTKTNTITVKAGANKVDLTTADITLPPKSGENFTATLKDSNGTPLENKKITFTIGSKTYSRTTDSNGQAKLKINLANIKTYTITTKYAGDEINSNGTSVSKITIKKSSLLLETYNRTYINTSGQYFHAVLKDSSGNPVANKDIIFTIGKKVYNKTTDSQGVAKLKINLAKIKTYTITTKYAGDIQNSSITKTNSITILDELNKNYIDMGLSNAEIQRVLDESTYQNIEFLGSSYDNIELTINQSLNLYPKVNTILNGADNSIVITIANDASGTNLNDFMINPNSGYGILVNNTDSINIENNTIKNQLNESLIDDYNNGSTILPGEGISIINSSKIDLINNNISSFESGLYLEESNNLKIEDNFIHENNYGIKYGVGVSNTEIINNTIIDNIGWYTMDEPEGPRGYGILFNGSAIDVDVSLNNISNNYIGISIDCNNSTGIVITSNCIADNSLEGIRFNAGYDLSTDAVEPYVSDNAIYRNAEGPSLMILGEVSANPGGIYGPGQWNDSLKLQLDANWYGANSLRTWDNDSGIVGVGTICPRIHTDPIYFENLTYQSPGTYKIDFYKNGTLDSNLAIFDMYATLNRGTDSEEECNFLVVDGIGTITFNTSNLKTADNKIEISIGSLNSAERNFNVIFNYYIPDSELQS